MGDPKKLGEITQEVVDAVKYPDGVLPDWLVPFVEAVVNATLDVWESHGVTADQEAVDLLLPIWQALRGGDQERLVVDLLREAAELVDVRLLFGPRLKVVPA